MPIASSPVDLAVRAGSCSVRRQSSDGDVSDSCPGGKKVHQVEHGLKMLSSKNSVFVATFNFNSTHGPHPTKRKDEDRPLLGVF